MDKEPYNSFILAKRIITFIMARMMGKSLYSCLYINTLEKNKEEKMVKVKKERKTDNEKQQIVSSLVIMDDAMFEAMCESPEFVEELLQTVLENPKLRIKYDSVVPQKSIKNLKGRSVRLDAYIEGENTVFNVEIQCSDNCNHVKRVRYNASLITANNSETGDEFDNIQNLYVVYITKSDFFKKGLTVYHAQTTILETGDLVDNGLKEIYINTTQNDGSRIAKLMSLFEKKELDENDKEEFPNTYNKFFSLKHDRQEVNRMCEKIENYAKKYAEKYAEKKAIYSAIESYEECGLSQEMIINKIIKRFSLTEDEAKQYYDDVFETV